MIYEVRRRGAAADGSPRYDLLGDGQVIAEGQAWGEAAALVALGMCPGDTYREVSSGGQVEVEQTYERWRAEQDQIERAG